MSFGGGHAPVSAFEIRNGQIVVDFSPLRPQTRRLRILLNCLRQTTRIIVRIAEFIMYLWGIGLEVQGLLISPDGVHVFSLLHFAVAYLYPGVSPSRVLVSCILEIPQRAVVVAQPKRVETSAVQYFCHVALVFTGNFHKGTQPV